MHKFSFLTYASRKCKSTFCILVFISIHGFLASFKLYGQEPPRSDINISEFLIRLFPFQSENSENTDLYESMLLLYANPLDLNLVTRDELAATFILSEEQLNSFFEYRRNFGPFLSSYELQAIPGFDLPTIQNLAPFVSVSPKPISLKNSFQNPTQNYLILRSSKLLEQQKGYSEIDTNSRSVSRYAGMPWNGYVRYRNSRSGVYSIGLTLEKDAGESLWDWKPQRQVFGVDFTSFHVQLMNRGRLRNLIIGDFQMQAGQGLVLAAGFSLGKGAEVVRTTYRSTLGLRPYTSALEANYFRGVAATYKLAKNTDITWLYSRTRRDASTSEAIEDPDQLIISSLVLSGYHRTPSEIAKHGIIPEQTIGFHLLRKLQGQKGQIGITALNTTYGAKILRRDLPYNYYEFSGKNNLLVGLHGDYHYQNFHFFGEGASSQNGALGALAGVIAGISKAIDFTLLMRYYAKDFHSFYGNSFSEGTRPINESGVYLGFRYTPVRKWQFSAYFDQFRFPWLKYQIDAPSVGYEYFLHTLYKPNKRWNIYFLYNEKYKERNQPKSMAMVIPVIGSIRRSGLVNFTFEKPMKYSLRTRVQFGSLSYPGISTSSGLTIAQDATWHFSKLELSARIAVFKTDDYDSRQYVYEKDMLYAFSIPAYYDTGTRHYVMVKYNLIRNMKVWLRWSQTRYSNLEKISSGLNEIKGKTRSDLKVQVMYQF